MINHDMTEACAIGATMLNDRRARSGGRWFVTVNLLEDCKHPSRQ
jgi:hypothetical protein|nr:hypothetical protein [Bradyrhizobium diazoefficiens]